MMDRFALGLVAGSVVTGMLLQGAGWNAIVLVFWGVLTGGSLLASSFFSFTQRYRTSFACVCAASFCTPFALTEVSALLVKRSTEEAVIMLLPLCVLGFIGLIYTWRKEGREIGIHASLLLIVFIVGSLCSIYRDPLWPLIRELLGLVFLLVGSAILGIITWWDDQRKKQIQFG